MKTRAHSGVHAFVLMINEARNTLAAGQTSGRAARGRIESVFASRPAVGQASRVDAVVLADLERVVQRVRIPEVDSGA